MSTYTDTAKKLALLLEYRTEDEDSTVVFTDRALNEWSADREQVSSLIHGIKASEDFVYKEVFRALRAIADEGFETVKNGLGYYCEPNIYTYDLLKWLAGSIWHVYYISEALERFGECGNDGFVLLAVAQEIAKQEIWDAVLDLVRDETE